jgi:hypothetical protein
LCEVDLSQLLKGDSFTFLYIINSNRLGIKTRILINIKANKYTFINTEFAAFATRFLNTKTQRLFILYNIRGFDSKIA